MLENLDAYLGVLWIRYIFTLQTSINIYNTVFYFILLYVINTQPYCIVFSCGFLTKLECSKMIKNIITFFGTWNNIVRGVYNVLVVLRGLQSLIETLDATGVWAHVSDDTIRWIWHQRTGALSCRLPPSNILERRGPSQGSSKFPITAVGAPHVDVVLYDCTSHCDAPASRVGFLLSFS